MSEITLGEKLHKRFELNLARNLQMDQTENIAKATREFKYELCANQYWNPESFSLLYGTPLWDQASVSQRIILNHLYWVAYYSQIVSAEIATIFLNQVSAAGLYMISDFDVICHNLDLETKQERVHIQAFRTIGEAVEQALFSKRLFTYPMRGLFTETMLYADSNYLKTQWRKLQLQFYTAVAANNVFLASQYLTIRGLRTLNGKMIQHQLSRTYFDSGEEESPIPSRISYYHFCDESFHFNTSKLIGLEIPSRLSKPSYFEKWAINKGVHACQKDHYHFSSVINGIFWYDPALYNTIYQLLRSNQFSFSHKDAMRMLKICFTEESEGLHLSYQTRHEAMMSYKTFVEPLTYLTASNREMGYMQKQSIPEYLKHNRSEFNRFEQKHEILSN